MGNREAEQLFPSEAEQQQQHQGPVQGRKPIISITCTRSSFQSQQRFQRRKHKDALKWRLQTPRELLRASDLDSP